MEEKGRGREYIWLQLTIYITVVSWALYKVPDPYTSPRNAEQEPARRYKLLLNELSSPDQIAASLIAACLI
jgi:hypothetical protein